MAVLCEQYQLLFIAIPGTGCTAITNVLLERLDGVSLGDPLISKHYNIAELLEHGLIDPEKLGSLVSFATIRNPYDWYVSDWLRHREWKRFLLDEQSWIHRARGAKRQRELVTIALERGFDDYLETVLEPLPDHGMFLERMWKGVDHILRYETLETDVNVVLAQAGFSKHVVLPVQNYTRSRLSWFFRKNHYSRFYTDRSVSLIERKFGPFLEKFDYQLDRSQPPESVRTIVSRLKRTLPLQRYLSR